MAKDTAYNDADAFRAAVKGQYIAYELATPQTYQLTPEEVMSIVHQNYVFADTGDVTVVRYTN